MTRGSIAKTLRFVILRILAPWLGLIGLYIAGTMIRIVYLRVPMPEKILQALDLPVEQARHRAFGVGSGFFVSDDGLVFTARHVVQGCAMLAARDELGNVYPLARIDTRQPADIALLQAVGATGHPYLPQLSGRVQIGSGQWLLATGIPGSGTENPSPRDLVRSFPLRHFTMPADHRLAAPYDRKRTGPLSGARGGPLTLGDNRVIGLLAEGSRAGIVSFEPVAAMDKALTLQHWQRIRASAASLQGAPIHAVVRIWCVYPR